jgi:acetyl esterase/lipase
LSTFGKPEAKSVRLISGIPYGEAGSRSLLLDLVLPHDDSPKPWPAALWVHGGGWSEGSRLEGLQSWCCTLLAMNGFVAASVGYQLTPEKPFPAQLHDVKGAIRWLGANSDRYGIDPNRIRVWGFSAGGHLAALAGTTGDLPELEGEVGPKGYSSRVQAVAAGSPATDLLRGGGAWLQRDHETIRLLFGGEEPKDHEMREVSPVYHVSPKAPPFLLAHGTRDQSAPFEQSIVLRDALLEVGVEVDLVPVEGAHHNWLPHPSRFPGDDGVGDFGAMTLAFFERRLRQ